MRLYAPNDFPACSISQIERECAVNALTALFSWGFHEYKLCGIIGAIFGLKFKLSKPNMVLEML